MSGGYVKMSQRECRRAVLMRDLGIVPLSLDRPYFPITDSLAVNGACTAISPPPLMLVATTARLNRHRHLTDLFWITELAIYSQADIHIVVFGDGPEREELLRKRDERLLAGRLHFVGCHDDVAEWLPAFDVFLETIAAGLSVTNGGDTQTRQQVLGIAVLRLYEDTARQHYLEDTLTASV